MTQILSAFSSINDSAFNYVESTAVVVLAVSGAGLLLEKLG